MAPQKLDSLIAPQGAELKNKRMKFKRSDAQLIVTKGASVVDIKNIEDEDIDDDYSDDDDKQLEQSK